MQTRTFCDPSPVAVQGMLTSVQGCVPCTSDVSTTEPCAFSVHSSRKRTPWSVVSACVFTHAKNRYEAPGSTKAMWQTPSKSTLRRPSKTSRRERSPECFSFVSNEDCTPSEAGANTQEKPPPLTPVSNPPSQMSEPGASPVEEFGSEREAACVHTRCASSIRCACTSESMNGMTSFSAICGGG